MIWLLLDGRIFGTNWKSLIDITCFLVVYSISICHLNSLEISMFCLILFINIQQIFDWYHHNKYSYLVVCSHFKSFYSNKFYFKILSSRNNCKQQFLLFDLLSSFIYMWFMILIDNLSSWCFFIDKLFKSTIFKLF